MSLQRGNSKDSVRQLSLKARRFHCISAADDFFRSHLRYTGERLSKNWRNSVISELKTIFSTKFLSTIEIYYLPDCCSRTLWPVSDFLCSSVSVFHSGICYF